MKAEREGSGSAFDQPVRNEEARSGPHAGSSTPSSRHSTFLIRSAARATLPPLPPLPVRARVGTQPSSAMLSEKAAAATLSALSASLSAAPAAAAATAPAAAAAAAPCFDPLPTSVEAVPAFDFAVPPFAASATTLAVPVAVIENPAGQPFSVRASVTWSGEGGRVVTAELGRIVPSLLPSEDGAGTYLLPLPPAVRELLRQREGRLRLRLAVRVAGAGRTPRPALHVKIVQPRWH